MVSSILGFFDETSTKSAVYVRMAYGMLLKRYIRENEHIKYIIIAFFINFTILV